MNELQKNPNIAQANSKAKKLFFPEKEQQRTILVKGDLSSNLCQHILLTWREIIKNPMSMNVIYIVLATQEHAKEIMQYLISQGVEYYILSTIYKKYTFTYTLSDTNEDTKVEEFDHLVHSTAFKHHLICWNSGKLLFVDFKSWNKIFTAWLARPSDIEVRLSKKTETDPITAENSATVVHYKRNNPGHFMINEKNICKCVNLFISEEAIIQSIPNLAITVVYLCNKECRDAFMNMAWYKRNESYKVEARKFKVPTSHKPTTLSQLPP